MTDCIKDFLFCADCDMMCKDAVVLNCGHTVCVYCSLDVCIQCRAPVKSRVPNRQIRRIIDTYQTDELCCRCDEDVCDWSDFEDSKDSESEKRFIATVAWEDGSRIKFGLTGNTYDGLVVLLDLWAAGTLAKTAQKANPLKLVLEDTDLPFAELESKLVWNVPRLLFDVLTEWELGTTRMISFYGCGVMLKAMLVLMADLRKYRAESHQLMTEVKAYCRDKNLAMCAKNDENQDRMWQCYLKNRYDIYPFAYPSFNK